MACCCDMALPEHLGVTLTHELLMCISYLCSQGYDHAHQRETPGQDVIGNVQLSGHASLEPKEDHLKSTGFFSVGQVKEDPSHSSTQGDDGRDTHLPQIC